MAGRVFISCGQATEEERDVAKKIADWLTSKGFFPFVATQIPTILELNTKIINELKKADFYLFINFKREQVCGKEGFRGSLYAHQEFAIALALGMGEKALLINQKEVIKEGIAGYLISNSGEFSEYDEVLQIVQEAIGQAGWDPSYSRNLSVNEECSMTGPEYYTDHVSGTRLVKILHAEIHNCRPDIAAIDFSARLIEIKNNNGASWSSHDKTPLKISGQMGYSTSIWPKSSCVLDLLSVEVPIESCTFPTPTCGTQQRPTSSDSTSPGNVFNLVPGDPDVYLNSASDIHPRSPIITEAGKYFLRYEAFSTGFNPIWFIVEFDLPQCEGKIIDWGIK